MSSDRPAYDVVIAGYGPVGAVLANLLGRDGRSVLVLERAEEIYDLPRAVHFDGDIMRIFQGLGLAESMLGITRQLRGAEFVTPSGERILGMAAPQIVDGPAGWPMMNLFYQPRLERVLRDAVGRFPSVKVRLGHEVTGLEQDDEGVEVAFREFATGGEHTARARYWVAADGAASFTRKQLGIRFESLAYDREWLVVDTMLRRPKEMPDLCQQICDPERPITFVPGQGAHRRWELQLRPGETRESMTRPERVFQLLAPWVSEDEIDLIRAVVYEFHGTVAERWRSGRVFVAGDAAHQMPPFMGQGMCSGLRDADNLAWKLGLVLDGRASDRLLDSYESERKPHADDIVDWAVSVGKLIDAFTRAQAGGEAPDPEDQSSGYGGGRRMPGLGPGWLQSDPPPGVCVGEPFPQARVCLAGGEEGRLDDWLGLGTALVLRGDPAELLGPESRALCTAVGARVVAIDELELREGWLTPLLELANAFVVRPDRQLAGAVRTRDELEALAASLRAGLG